MSHKFAGIVEVDSEKESLFVINVIVSKVPDKSGCYSATPIGLNGERLTGLTYKARMPRAAVIGCLKESIR